MPTEGTSQLVKTRLTDQDIYHFREGTHYTLFDKLGAHYTEIDGRPGTYFAVWAPNAESVSVIGSFNGWNNTATPLSLLYADTGIWEGFVPGLGNGELYKFHIRSKYNGYHVDKGDPFAKSWEIAPKTASVTWDLTYDWDDGDWMENRHRHNALDAPMSIYEMHFGSWAKVAEEGGRSLHYREMAPHLAGYLKKMGFTHVEFLPVMEHPFYGSWGYQTLGYFAPTSRFGTPQDFMYLIDYLHREGIGVILDWVPSHFPSDEYGLVNFDGTHLYEHEDPRIGFHPEWKSSIFNYGRNEVREFLISSARFWLDVYHADGLRVDAVASMLYRDYARREGEWIPNEYGGNENIEAIEFLKQLNSHVYSVHPDINIIAEESTSWPMVTRPTSVGGLGFGMKWNMGWMHDVLDYFNEDPVYRKYHHNNITFSIMYAFSENFMLPLSHDEVVHGKGSLLGKMSGDEWQKFANLRLLLGYQFTHPGKKLLFMGGEFGQGREWTHDHSLEWHLLEYDRHRGISNWVEDLNRVYRKNPALYERDFHGDGFRWIDCNDIDNSVILFRRMDRNNASHLIVACNFTPVPQHNYMIGVPEKGFWKEILNSDARHYGGSGQGNFGGLESSPVAAHDAYHSINALLPPLGIVIFRHEGVAAVKADDR